MTHPGKETAILKGVTYDLTNREEVQKMYKAVGLTCELALEATQIYFEARQKRRSRTETST